jgi:L-alanine-DL-glutamate epimerase-like enolase superfamily enzyme
LAGALRPIDAVELIPESSGACPMYDLIHGKPSIDNGILTIDDKPGAGFDLNWKIVEKTAATSWTLDAQISCNRP